MLHSEKFRAIVSYKPREQKSVLAVEFISILGAKHEKLRGQLDFSSDIESANQICA